MHVYGEEVLVRGTLDVEIGSPGEVVHLGWIAKFACVL